MNLCLQQPSCSSFAAELGALIPSSGVLADITRKTFLLARTLGSLRSTRRRDIGTCFESYEEADMVLPGDLRDRHKRRCAKSSTKVKVSKRKSCLACAQSKLGCDLDTPACSRCVSRGTKCEYAVPPPSALQGGLPKQMTARSHPHLALQTAQRASSFVKQNAGYQYHANNGHPELTCIPVSSSSGYPTPPFHDSMMPWHDNYQGYQSFDLFGSLTMQPFLPHVPSTPSSGHPSTCFDGSEFDSFTPQEMPPAFQDWYQDSGIDSGFHAQHASEHEQWHGDSDHKPLREVDNNVHYSSHGPVENQSFSLFHALNIPVHHDPSLSPTNSVGQVEPHSTFFNSLAMPYEVSRSGTGVIFNHSHCR